MTSPISYGERYDIGSGAVGSVEVLPALGVLAVKIIGQSPEVQGA